MGDSSARLEVTVGMEKGFAARPSGREVLRRLRDMGVTSVETYVRWIDFEPEPGQFDWSVFDADLEALLAHGLRWVPFFIAGPWYATPEWFRRGAGSLFARCLEHDRDTGTQSIWNPHLFPEVQRLMRALAEHYRSGDGIESLLLGVTGDYGEAIYTVTGNWPGDYHGHGGYWCGDLLARADFRRWLSKRYPEGRAAAWGSLPVESLQPPPSPAAVPSPEAWLDFVTWYRAAMTDWSARWLIQARAVLPQTTIYLCTGGDMTPAHGSDFSAQCRVAGEFGAGVRITNEGSDFVHNLLLTRLVASAGRHYGAFFGFEPAAAVDAHGVAARQFNAAGSGARQLHEYQNNLINEHRGQAVERPDAVAAWLQGRPLLREGDPVLTVGLVHSLPDLALHQAGILGGALPLARTLRTSCDFEVLDDHLVADGALDHLRAVFLAPCHLWAEETVRRLAAFVETGGICVAAGMRPRTLGAQDTAGALFGFGPSAEECTGISAVVVAAGSPLTEYGRAPTQHTSSSFQGLDSGVVPLLRVAHTPRSGVSPLVAWHRPLGRGTAVFYTGALAAGSDWMAAPGAAEALVRSLLTELPVALGLPPVETASVRGVYETPLADRDLAWNATGNPVSWRGITVEAWSLAEAPRTGLPASAPR